MLTRPSSAAVVLFPAVKPTFAEAWKTYREGLLDLPLTNAEFRFAVEFVKYFNREYFEKTGQLIAWPMWTTLMAKTGLGKMTVHRTIKKFKRFGALEVERHRYNHMTKKRAHNIYQVPAGFLAMSLRKR